MGSVAIFCAYENKERWYDLDRISEWISTDPDITDKDLRPYYYASKEKFDYFSGKVSGNNLSELVCCIVDI